MPSPPNLTNITPPRVPIVDERTGLISREWYRFFLNLFNLTGGGSNTASLIDLQLEPPAPQQIAELQKQVEGLAATPIPALGTFAALQQDNLPWTTFDETPQAIPTTIGTLAWDGGTTLGLQATANVLMQIGESEFVYVKASATITKGQLCYHTGSVGASGVVTAAPTPLNLTDPNQIVGVAAESIALNGFGLIQISGTLRGFDTTGSSVSEIWADGDPLYYNPAYVGSLTKTKPSAPNQKTYIGEVINAGNGGSGSISIRLVPGSVLGGTDSNVQITSVADKDLLQYDSVLQYWKNVPASTLPVGTATNLAGGAAGSVPYQSAPSTTTFLGIGATGRWLGSSGTAPQWNAPAALTKTDDTNVTLTLGGSATTALLNAASLTLGWTGQLSLTRGGTNASLTASAGSVAYSTASALELNTAGSSGDWLKSAGTAAPVWTAPAALTKTDDTNVTLTLGGSASTALLNAASLTLGWTGQLAVSRGGTGLASGTSGGVLYYSATGTLASSAALAANALVIGGGAGIAPSTITTGTGVVTALGVNTGTAGAFVVNGGALGTPSSGTVTNLTGTASININGTVGATTANTGAFTTLTASGNTSISPGQLLLGTASANTNDQFQIGSASAVLSTNLTATSLNGIGVRYTNPTTATATQRGLLVAINGGDSAGAYTTTNVYGANVADYILGSNQTVTTQYGVAVNALTAGSTIYGVWTNTSSGTNKWNFYAAGTADNAFRGNNRFGGVTAPTVAVDVTGAILATTNIRSSGATSGIGYATGAGGTVTQGAGSGKATAVTLNNVTGQITMNNAALNANTTVTFTLTNSAVAATDLLVLNHVSGGTAGAYTLNAQAGAGTVNINVRNITAGNLSEAIVIGFAVIKAVTA